MSDESFMRVLLADCGTLGVMDLIVDTLRADGELDDDAIKSLLISSVEDACGPRDGSGDGDTEQVGDCAVSEAQSQPER